MDMLFSLAISWFGRVFDILNIGIQILSKCPKTAANILMQMNINGFKVKKYFW